MKKINVKDLKVIKKYNFGSFSDVFLVEYNGNIFCYKHFKERYPDDILNNINELKPIGFCSEYIVPVCFVKHGDNIIGYLSNYNKELEELGDVYFKRNKIFFLKQTKALIERLHNDYNRIHGDVSLANVLVDQNKKDRGKIHGLFRCIFSRLCYTENKKKRIIQDEVNRMNRKFRLSTALDIDDVLMECIPYAIRLANEKYQFDPPLTIYEVDRWGELGTRADVIFEFFQDPEFFKNQPVIKGAREFVKKLSQLTEVFVSTSVYPEFMSIRAQRIMEEFPEIHPDHIYMGSRKDKIDVDILFDDGMHNVFRSNATYPILMRRPWNQDATGVLAVNTYDEFLKLVEVIADSYSVKKETRLLQEPSVIVLVGPSGSGKNDIVRSMTAETDRVERLPSYTTVEQMDMFSMERYRYVSEAEFLQMYQQGELFEITNYGNHYYGSRKEDVEKILESGRHALTVMDICGAMSLKTHFPNVVTIYIKRDKRDLLTAILEKDIPTQQKVNRLLALESERKNAEVCDYVVDFTTCEQTVERIMDKLSLR